MEYVYVFAFQNGTLLLVRNRNRGWEAPGGKIEEGERPEDAARREFLEETGRALEILCYESVGDGHVFYGIAGEVLEEVSDPIIEDTAFFEELPHDLAFSVEEYRELIEHGQECLVSKGKLLNHTS